MSRVVTAGRLRQRLAITFALVAAIATGALALGTYLVVRSSRLDDSVDSSLAQARTNLVLAGTVLRGSSAPQDVADLLEFYAGRPDYETVALVGGEAFAIELRTDADPCRGAAPRTERRPRLRAGADRRHPVPRRRRAAAGVAGRALLLLLRGEPSTTSSRSCGRFSWLGGSSWSLSPRPPVRCSGVVSGQAGTAPSRPTTSRTEPVPTGSSRCRRSRHAKA